MGNPAKQDNLCESFLLLNILSKNRYFTLPACFKNGLSC